MCVCVWVCVGGGVPRLLGYPPALVGTWRDEKCWHYNFTFKGSCIPFFFSSCWLSNAASGSTSGSLRHNCNCDCSRTFLKISPGSLVLNFISGCWFNRVALYLINYLPSVAKGFCPSSNGANYRTAIKLTMM